MQQYIRDLKQYPKLYQEALKYLGDRSEDRYRHNPEYLDVENSSTTVAAAMVDWDFTPQGSGFWACIHNGEYPYAKIYYPQWEHLFSTEPLELEISNNGLWL